MNIDLFIFGAEPLGLLLFWGDLATARAAQAKVLDAHPALAHYEAAFARQPRSAAWLWG